MINMLVCAANAAADDAQPHLILAGPALAPFRYLHHFRSAQNCRFHAPHPFSRMIVLLLHPRAARGNPRFIQLDLDHAGRPVGLDADDAGLLIHDDLQVGRFEAHLLIVAQVDIVIFREAASGRDDAHRLCRIRPVRQLRFGQRIQLPFAIRLQIYLIVALIQLRSIHPVHGQPDLVFVRLQRSLSAHR